MFDYIYLLHWCWLSSPIRLRDGIRNLLSISRLGNQYIQANKPWVLVKGTDDDK